MERNNTRLLHGLLSSSAEYRPNNLNLRLQIGQWPRQTASVLVLFKNQQIRSVGFP